jgi:hypothetical protein
MHIMKTSLIKVGTLSSLSMVLALTCVFAQTTRSYGQTENQTQTQPSGPRARLDSSAQPPPEESGRANETTGKASSSPMKVADPAVPAEITRELEVMKARIAELES